MACKSAFTVQLRGGGTTSWHLQFAFASTYFGKMALKLKMWGAVSLSLSPDISWLYADVESL